MAQDEAKKQDAVVEPIDENAWQQTTTEEDRRFWRELEPNLQPLMAESLRRMYLRNEAARKHLDAEGHMELEQFFGIVLLDGLTGRREMLEPIERQMNKAG
ncbi:MAG: hypothetical protein LLF76_03205 [Planctomycetaceae bacterium]|nr:hypothetical protein [Planctomycetaceae bacterium]